jgi:transposase-like protein
MNKPKKFSPEVRERAVRLVFECREEHPSQWAAVVSIAGKIGCMGQTLLSWVRRHECDTGQRTGLTSAEQQRLKELEREVKELRKTDEIHRSADAFFAQAELDRRFKS